MTQTTLGQCLDWLHGQIAFKPNHSNWDVIVSIIERLEEPNIAPINNEKLRAIVEQIPLKETP